MSIDPTVFRKALGGFASGVTVVTARQEDGVPVGVTVSAFCSLSLDPPQVIYCLDNRNTNLDAYLSGGANVHILASDQSELSNRFATPMEDRFAGLEMDEDRNGAPVLPGCLVRIGGTVAKVVDGGDHQIVILRIEDAEVRDDGEPLLYLRGRYGVFAPL
ncbi:MAG: flavin reductase family protein [Rhodospirillaceae bacterium]